MNTILRTDLIKSVTKSDKEIGQAMAVCHEKHNKALDLGDHIKCSNIRGWIGSCSSQDLSGTYIRMVYQEVLRDMKIHISETI